MNSFQFGNISAAAAKTLEYYFQSTGPDMAVRETLRFIDKNFQLKGWQGASLQPWQQTKRGGSLVKTGALRRSFNHTNEGNGTIRFYSNIIYASIHNRGGEITRYSHSENFVRNRYTKGKYKGMFAKGTTAGHGFTKGDYVIKMPQRQFAPTDASPSPILEADIIKWLEHDIKNILTF